MEIGLCCGNDEAAFRAARAGSADYVELSAASSLNPETQDAAAVSRLALALERSGMAARAFNILLPPDLPCVGPDVDWGRLDRYLGGVFERAARLDGRVVVFGSGRQRSIPEGFPAGQARNQLLGALRCAAGHASGNGVEVVLEPLNAAESNQVLSVAEAAAIARELDCPGLRVLSDLYHVSAGGQSFEETAQAGLLLAHVHVAGAERRAPRWADLPEITGFVQAVKASGYDARVSVEANWTDFAAEAAEAVEVTRAAWLRA